MTLTFPYPLASLADVLRADDCQFYLRRNDEMSGSGDGRFWTAELARPLWEVTLSLAARTPADARAIDAKVFTLNGSSQSFLFAEPTYAPAGGGVPGSGVTIDAIASDGLAIALAGLPAGYVVTAGDRFSVAWGTGRQYLGMFAETATADGSGDTAQIAITPWLPIGIATTAAVEMTTPVLRAFVPPGGYRSFGTRSGGLVSQGASLTMVQRP